MCPSKRPYRLHPGEPILAPQLDPPAVEGFHCQASCKSGYSTVCHRVLQPPHPIRRSGLYFFPFSHTSSTCLHTLKVANRNLVVIRNLSRKNTHLEDLLIDTRQESVVQNLESILEPFTNRKGLELCFGSNSTFDKLIRSLARLTKLTRLKLHRMSGLQPVNTFQPQLRITELFLDC